MKSFFYFHLEFTSCVQAYEQGERKSGLYFLTDSTEDLSAWHYCNMEELDDCGSGGWTLVMLADGNKVLLFK